MISKPVILTPEQKADRSKKSSYKKGNKIDFKCVAWLNGRLVRSLPNDKGDRTLMFRCTDGSVFRVLDLARSDSTFITRVLADIEKYFKEDHLWSVYPQALNKFQGVVPFACGDGRDRPVDWLEFEASVGKSTSDTSLALYVGRRGHSNKDFNFYNVVIPKDFKLPKGLKFGRHVVGKAKRDGNIFVLSELKIIYGTKNSVRPDKSSSSKGELSERRDVGTSSSQLDVPT